MESSDHETIEDDVGAASSWLACRCGGELEKGGREKGTAAAMETEDWRRKTSGQGRGRGRVEGARIECRSYCGE